MPAKELARPNRKGVKLLYWNMKKSIFKKQPSPIPRYVPTNEYFRRIVAISGALLTMLALCETDSQTANNRMFLALQNCQGEGHVPGADD